MPLSVRYADGEDIDHVVRLSARVQDTLTASGSLQQIGPLELNIVREAASEQHCFVAVAEERDLVNEIVACALVHPIDERFYSTATGFNIASFPSSWLYMHAIMLDPASQGQGLGPAFVKNVVTKLKDDSRYRNGTAFLGCWVGSDHLRRFYEKIGFQLARVVTKEHYEVAVYSISLKQETEVSSVRLTRE